MASRPQGYASSKSDSEPETDQSLTNIFTSRAFTDPVFAHLSRTLSIRELVRLKPVCKAIAPLISENSFFTAHARSQNDSMDCYFPLYFDKHQVGPRPDASKKRKQANTSWVWSGVHHLTRETHTLPSLDYLPFSQMWDKCYKRGDISACLLPTSGSLLLFILKAKNQQGDGVWNNTNLMSKDHLEDGLRAHWIPLLVTNPLTQEYRVLPEPANAESTSWDYEGARAHLVEDKYVNTYRVLLVFRDSLYVYKSTTKCWKSWNFKKIIPWGIKSYLIPTNFLESGVYYDVPCSISGGKLWYAELVVDEDVDARAFQEMDTIGLTEGGVRVFEVDEEGGTWKPAIRYALKDFIPQDLHDAHTLGFGFAEWSFVIEMVECMGGQYILIPAYLDVSMIVGEDIKQLYNLTGNAIGGERRRSNVTYKDFGFLGIRFYVLQLKGDGLRFGQALVKLPHNTPHPYEEWNPMQLGWNPEWTVTPSPLIYARGWGSVISIMFETYFIRYDVMSGISTTEVLANDSFIFDPDVSYKPSFYIKP